MELDIPCNRIWMQNGTRYQDGASNNNPHISAIEQVCENDYSNSMDLHGRHYIFGPFSPQLVNCDLAEVWAPLAIDLDILLQPVEVPAFLHYRLSEIIHEVNHTPSSVILNFRDTT